MHIISYNFSWYRTVREVRGRKDKIITDEEVNQFLILFFTALENQIKTIECKSQLHELVAQHEKTEKITSLYGVNKCEKFDHCSQCGGGEHTIFNQIWNLEKEGNPNYDEILYKQNILKMKKHLKFVTERGLSLLPSGGLGVVVTDGDIPPNTIVSMYPGKCVAREFRLYMDWIRQNIKVHIQPEFSG